MPDVKIPCPSGCANDPVVRVPTCPKCYGANFIWVPEEEAPGYVPKLSPGLVQKKPKQLPMSERLVRLAILLGLGYAGWRWLVWMATPT